MAKLEDLLGKFGFEIDKDGVAGVFGEDGKALFKRAEDSLNDLRAGSLGIESGFDVSGALDGLSSGVNKLVDGLNQGWSDYWSGIFNSNAGGAVTGSDGQGRATARYVGGVLGWAVGAVVGAATGTVAGTAQAGPVGGVIGMGLGTASGMEAGVDVGAWLGGAAYDVGEFFVDVFHSIFGGGDDKKQGGKKDGGASEPGEDGEGEGASIVTDKPVRPLMPYFSTRKTLIEFDRGEFECLQCLRRADKDNLDGHGRDGHRQLSGAEAAYAGHGQARARCPEPADRRGRVLSAEPGKLGQDLRRLLGALAD